MHRSLWVIKAASSLLYHLKYLYNINMEPFQNGYNYYTTVTRDFVLYSEISWLVGDHAPHTVVAHCDGARLYTL